MASKGTSNAAPVRRKRYVVEYHQDADGFWCAALHVEPHGACFTDGRSISEARKRIRGALAVYLDDKKAAEAAELVDEVKLPRHLKGTVSKARRVREQAQAAQAKALEVSEAAARELTAAGLSTRDAAELLGVSHQRVHQFAGGEGKPRKRARKVA